MWLFDTRNKQEIGFLAIKQAEQEAQIRSLRSEYDALEAKFKTLRGQMYRAKGWEDQKTEEQEEKPQESPMYRQLVRI
jgi:hypothetical protein